MGVKAENDYPQLMNLDVLSITTLSILLFLPYNYQCIEELNPDGLDPDEFDFSYDKKSKLA